jgi:2'-5' RNA ligase
MRAALALLADREASNLVRRLSWQIHGKYHTGLAITRLPPHISLKQPFEISDTGGLEAYMLELARDTGPFDIRLTQLQLIPIESEGIRFGLLWIEVQENETLRRLHETLNRELEVRFGNTAAHLTARATTSI